MGVDDERVSGFRQHCQRVKVLEAILAQLKGGEGK